MIKQKGIIYKGAIICDKDQEQKKDIKVENFGSLDKDDFRIVEIGDVLNARDGEKVINASGLYILPNIIDLNIRIKNDVLNVEHIQRLAKKANKSGIGAFVIMPDCKPNIDDETTVEMIKLEKEITKTPIIPVCNSIKSDGKLSNIAIMADLGCEAIYMHSKYDSNLIQRVAQYAVMKNKPILCRCENLSLSESGMMNDGEISSNLGLVGISKLAEISEVARVSQIVKSVGASTIFQSISTSESLDIIDNIKQDIKNVYSEVSIHHLCLNDSACVGYNTSAKINPPLREEAHRQKLVKALQDGKIDLLTSLHSPKSLTKKDVPFAEAEYGIDAIEFYFALCYTKLVKDNIISLSKLSQILSYNPANIMGMENIGLIKEGYKADFMLVDLNKDITITNNSPYKNSVMFGAKVN